MPPPPAEPFASRIFLGPALRTQPDRRLVKLVREGYEAAFEEIVRRYRKPLDRFAAAFVGGRSEDVTQDAFSKALLALRGSENEIELRPWLYRIVRNTALNDLRDRPPTAAELNEAALSEGGLSAAAEAERREEMAELMERLRALPEPQRAAIVMRELEGLSHEEIAAALGVSGGAARQTIYRARMALRDGFGLLVPLPLLRFLFDHGAEAAGAGGAAAAAGAGAMAGGSGAVLGGFGAAGALKVGVATAVLAGSVGAGVAMQHDQGRPVDPQPAAATSAALPGAGGSSGSSGSGSGDSEISGPGPGIAGADDSGRGGDDDGSQGRGGGGSEGRRGDRGEDSGGDSSGDSGSGSSGGSGHGGPGRGGRGPSDKLSDDHSGEGASGGSHSGGHGSRGSSGSSGHGSDGSGEDSGGSSGSGKGSGSGSSGSSGSGGSDGGHGSGGGSDDLSGGDGGGHGSSEPAPVTTPPPPPPAPESPESGGGSDGSGSGSGGSGLSGGSGDDDL